MVAMNMSDGFVVVCRIDWMWFGVASGMHESHDRMAQGKPANAKHSAYTQLKLL